MIDRRRKDPPLLGVVMAGGRSARYGGDKAAIEISGQALLDRTVELLGEFVDTVYVSIARDQVSDGLRNKHALLIDEHENLGPTAGLMAAHKRAPDHAWLALACDMPLMDRVTLRELIAQRDACKAATAYLSPSDGAPEPLCAIYEPDTLTRFGRKVESGQKLAPRQELATADVRLFNPMNPAALSNVNRPEDMAKLEPIPTIKR